MLNLSGMHRTPKKTPFRSIGIAASLLIMQACVPSGHVPREAKDDPPKTFKNVDRYGSPKASAQKQDSSNSAKVHWEDFFKDPKLKSLIDTALKKNQELKILAQEIKIAENEIQAARGEYLPSVDIKAGGELEKQGRYTRHGAVDHSTEIRHGEEFPEPFSDLMIGAQASWEVGIWNKLKNAKGTERYKYLARKEGRNFTVTNLVAEIANAYYELLALDRKLKAINRNIRIQKDALDIVEQQKKAGNVTELAVKKFQAELYKTQSLRFTVQQKITQAENELDYLVGRYPQPVQRDSSTFRRSFADSLLQAGLPSQLLQNRPDVRQARMKLEAAKMEVGLAKARFYPSLELTAGGGYEAFNPKFLLQTPESMLYSMAGELVAPLINRKAIKTAYYNANAEQLQAVYHYERTLLKAYTEVVNQLSRVENLNKSYELHRREVETLSKSIGVARDLFRSARAEYMEVLMTQRDALNARLELIETQKQRMNAIVKLYRALGGGWEQKSG